MGQEIVVAGHICLDVIPTFAPTAGAGPQLVPGTLVKVGPALCSTGGAVANTGLALQRLGLAPLLMGKVGDDLFGSEILKILRRHGAELAAGMRMSPGETSSYSIVLSPPGTDRMFLHCPGANDTFAAADVDYERLGNGRLFHFGYPPLMRRMYLEEGAELRKMLARVKGLGLTTSLDMADADAESEAGQVDWVSLLMGVLPQVDVFLPSIEELLFMLDRPRREELRRRHGHISIPDHIDGRLLHELSGKLLEMGAGVVVIKLGDQGVYLRSSADSQRLASGRMGRCAPAEVDAWVNRELLVPCFQANVVGTTGSGDCTIAGFLAGLSLGHSPQQAVELAVAVGACSVEQADATSGIPALEKVRQRMAAGWARLPQRMHL